MPGLDDLWGLITHAVGYLLCTLVDFVMSIVLVVMTHIFALLPSIAVPSIMLDTPPIALASLHLVAYFFPTGFLIWYAGVIVAFEAWYSVVVPLYRSIMDLF